MSSNSREMLSARKKAYRSYVRGLSLTERLRQLEALQEQTYEILRIRAANGGRPLSRGWRHWASAQATAQEEK